LEKRGEVDRSGVAGVISGLREKKREEGRCLYFSRPFLKGRRGEFRKEGRDLSALISSHRWGERGGRAAEAFQAMREKKKRGLKKKDAD